jgi:hypothetical protein
MVQSNSNKYIACFYNNLQYPKKCAVEGIHNYENKLKLFCFALQLVVSFQATGSLQKYHNCTVDLGASP